MNKPKASSKPRPSNRKILVVNNGFVFVGDVVDNEDNVQVNNCKNIRSWGTTQGLGELRNGPTSKTITDDCGSITVPLSQIVFTIEIQAGWDY